MRNVIFIHGANMTGTSFNYLLSQISVDCWFCPEYCAQDGLEKNIDLLSQQVDSVIEQEEFAIVAHSLGGLIGLGIAHQMKNCTSLITMSTPWGGSILANTLSWIMPHNRLLADISTISTFRRRLISDVPPVPTLCLVSTMGNSPFNYRENDGVVSIASQEELPGALIKHLPLNHCEILLSDITVSEIQKFL